MLDFYESLDSAERKVFDRKYNAFLESKPCSICGARNTSKPHHVRLPGNAGMGMKPADIYQIPICYNHHIKIHTMGAKTFQETFEVDFQDILQSLHTEFMNSINYSEKPNS